MAAAHARLKRVGRKCFAEHNRGDDFFTVANLGPVSTVDSLNKRRVNGIDLAHWAPMTDMQMFEEMPQPGSLESGVIISNIFAFRWAMAAGTRAGTLLYRSTDEFAADLSEAEVAAGGGGAFIQPGTNAPEARKRWKHFFSQHAALWDGGSSWARVGLLFWSDQVFYEYPEHLAMTYRLVHVLSETQTPFDMIAEKSQQSLNPYDVIIAPRLRYLDDSQIKKLMDYARGGGNLVVIEPFGSEDKYARPREADPLAKVGAKTGDFQPAVCGAGKILRLKPEWVPRRQSDFWCLMEERANAFVLMRKYLDQTRKADIEQGLDLGPQWVQRVEDALGLRLRWCPAGTDAGVYLHTYRIPARPGAPDMLVVHLVNYRLPVRLERETAEDEDQKIWIGTTSGEPVVAKNIPVTVPLPEGANVKSVQALSPTDGVGPVRWAVKNGRLTIRVKELRIYQALVIELQS